MPLGQKAPASLDGLVGVGSLNSPKGILRRAPAHHRPPHVGVQRTDASRDVEVGERHAADVRRDRTPPAPADCKRNNDCTTSLREGRRITGDAGKTPVRLFRPPAPVSPSSDAGARCRTGAFSGGDPASSPGCPARSRRSRQALFSWRAADRTPPPPAGCKRNDDCTTSLREGPRIGGRRRKNTCSAVQAPSSSEPVQRRWRQLPNRCFLRRRPRAYAGRPARVLFPGATPRIPRLSRSGAFAGGDRPTIPRMSHKLYVQQQVFPFPGRDDLEVRLVLHPLDGTVQLDELVADDVVER